MRTRIPDRIARPIHICVRETLDWGNAEIVKAQILPHFRSKFDTWNATFDMPYHVYRARVKAIAQLNLSRVAGARCSALETVPAGHLIVPVDDDDWFAPEFAERLFAEQTVEHSCYLWRRTPIEAAHPIRNTYLRVAALVGRGDRVICQTNNYAIVQQDGLGSLALSHMAAAMHFRAHPADVKRIPATLAIQNRHLGSQTTLAWRRPSIAPHQLVTLLGQHQKRYRSWRLPRDQQWARPYVDLMADLLSDIRPT